MNISIDPEKKPLTKIQHDFVKKKVRESRTGKNILKYKKEAKYKSTANIKLSGQKHSIVSNAYEVRN